MTPNAHGVALTETLLQGHSWNVVLLKGRHYLCDVMHDPGMLYDVDCKKTQFYHRDVKLPGRIHVAGPGLNSLPLPQAVARDAEADPQDDATRSAPSEVLGYMEQIQKDCERLITVHHANQALQQQLHECRAELDVKDQQIERMARVLVKLSPDEAW